MTSEQWLKEQQEVWGDGPEFKALCESIGRRNDAAPPHEADEMVVEMVEARSSTKEIADALLEWAIAEVPKEGAYLRALERFERNKDYLLRRMDGPGYPNGSPIADRVPHSTVHTVVNCLLRGRPEEVASATPRA